MNIRRLQGWALIISALVSISKYLFNFTGLTNRIQYLPETLALVSAMLFVFGLPGIQAVQPKTKYWGIIGLVLMVIPQLDQFFFGLINLLTDHPLELNQLQSSIWDSLAAVGIVYLGYILVGWLTIRARVFPGWVGWSFFIAGILNSAFWLLISHGKTDFLSLSTISNFVTFVDLLETVALIGYGWNIIQYKTHNKKRSQSKKRTQQSVHPTSESLRDP